MVIRTKGKRKSSVNLHQLKATGLLDGYVIKQYKEKIVLAAPQKKTKTNPTAEQRAQRFNLKQAVAQAKRINADPVQKAKWKKKAKGYSNVYQAAMAWYMKHPTKVLH